jgi:anti-anti-sigma factor
MHISTRHVADTVICELNGDLTYANRQPFKAAVDQARQGGCRHLIVNLEHVRFIDSSGLGMLALAATSFKALQRRVSLLKPQQYVREILTLANLAAMIPIYDSEEEALREVPAPTWA